MQIDFLSNIHKQIILYKNLLDKLTAQSESVLSANVLYLLFVDS